MYLEESDSEDETGSIPSDEDETLDLDQVDGHCQEPEQNNTNPELRVCSGGANAPPIRNFEKLKTKIRKIDVL